MIVIERQDPAQTFDARLCLGADHHGAVWTLPGVDDLVLEGAGQDAVEKRARRVVREPRGQRQRVGATGLKLEVGHEPMMPPPVGGTLTPNGSA